MTLRKTIAGLAILAVAWLPGNLAAQTAAEQAELDADAAGVIGPPGQPTTLGTGGACPAGTVLTTIHSSDFDNSDSGWTAGGFGEWERGPIVTGVFENCDTTPRPEPAGAPTGTNVFANNLNGCYTNAGAESLLSQTFDFSNVVAPIQLSWQGWYEVFVSFDMGEVLVNGNLEWEITTTAATGFVPEGVSLDAYAGMGAVTIDYRLFATAVVNRSGWYVDDIEIAGCVAVPDADVSLTKSVDNPTPGPGDTIVYTLTATNNGPDDVTDAVVTDDLPIGLSYVSDDCGGSYAAPTFTWNLGALANGASAVCNVTVSVDAPSGDLVNNASVTSGANDPVPANNAASSSITVGQPVQEIPTLGTWGVAVLALLLLASAALLLRRRADPS